MHRLLLPAVLLVPAILLAQAGGASSKSTTRTKMDPLELHNSALIIDTHADTPQAMLDEGYDLGAPSETIHVNLDKARRGNLGAEFFSIWVDPKYKGQGFAHRTLQLIDSVYQAAAAHPDRMMMAFSPDD